MSETEPPAPQRQNRQVRSPIDFAALPAGTTAENVQFWSQDGALCRGMLYTRGGEKTAICITHPRGDLSRHYMIPYFLDAGVAVCAFTHRALSDVALMHETMLLDIAASIRMLKQERAFERVVLLGNSIGGGVMGLYQWQAETTPPNRLSSTPSGDACDLNTLDLPPGDGLILLASSFGEAAVVARGLDPSVIDEADPFSCEAALDMFDTRNGYREPPEDSRYDADFVVRYKAAQTERLQRLEAKARTLIAEQQRHGLSISDGAFARLSINERSYARRRATDIVPMIVFRTNASLAFCDLSLSPSKRSVGAFGSDAQTINYSRQAIGQLKTPRAWLSASCETTSRSDLRQALPHIAVPTVIINFTADRTTYPEDAERMLALSASPDKDLHHIDGEHFGRPVKDLSDPAPRETVARLLSAWLRERFPAGRRI